MSIIGDIERDDFSSCGGDFYARGHIRAIARAVDLDPRPLIEDFDAARRAEQLAEEAAQAEARAELAGSGGLPLSESLLGLGWRDRRDRRDRRSSRDWRARGHRRGVNWTAVLAVLVVFAIGFGGYLLATGSAGGKDVDAARSAHSSAGQGAKPKPAASTPAPVVTRVKVIRPVSAQAFGPAGASTGDDPGDSGLAIDGDAATAWHTDWYATAEFGALQSGTGLLLDLGKPMTITAARLALGQAVDAGVQLRAGNTPVLADLRPVARTSDAGGSVALTVGSPVAARYLLLWFTKLPEDSVGTFMASVYSIRLDGLPGRLGPGSG